MITLIGWVLAHTGMISGIASGLFVVSETLAAIPSIKANSVFQVIQGILEKIKGA